MRDGGNDAPGRDGRAGEDHLTAAEIERRAQMLRDEDGIIAAEAYLHEAVATARRQHDPEAECAALQWLATTVAFGSRRGEGVEYAHQALEAAQGLAATERIKAALTLAGLLTHHGPEANQEAERMLVGLATLTACDEVDGGYEDLRLQRLEGVYRSSGRRDEARRVLEKVEAWRASGKGFGHDQAGG